VFAERLKFMSDLTIRIGQGRTAHTNVTQIAYSRETSPFTGLSVTFDRKNIGFLIERGYCCYPIFVKFFFFHIVIKIVKNKIIDILKLHLVIFYIDLYSRRNEGEKRGERKRESKRIFMLYYLKRY